MSHHGLIKMTNNISVVINTLNESNNIRNCLESVKWANEIIIVDMYSDDNTVSIAKEYTSKIFFHEKMGYVEPARKFAISKASNEWILLLDADELITQVLAEKLNDIIKENKCDAIWLPRENYFFGEKIKYTGWGAVEDKQLRFFKKNTISHSDKIHERAEIDHDAKVYEILDPKFSIVHFNYIDIEQFIDKLNRYTTIEAKYKFSNKENTTILNSICLSCYEFIKRFFIKKGYKDGRIGLYLSLLMFFYRLTTGIKLQLMLKFNSDNVKDSVIDVYQKNVEKIIEGYKK